MTYEQVPYEIKPPIKRPDMKTKYDENLLLSIAFDYATGKLSLSQAAYAVDKNSNANALALLGRTILRAIRENKLSIEKVTETT